MRDAQSSPATLADPVIQMENVTVPAIDDPLRPLVQGINWSVATSDYWVVGGRPGGGKTDLLAVAAGLLRPMRGTHRLFGRDLTGLQGDEPLAERLRIGLVFEDGGRVFNAVSVRENLALPLCYHHNCIAAEVEARVEAILDATALSAFADVPAGRLNRSWRQRTALARALALQPEVLLLDNPLAGLDPRQLQWWIEFLAALAAGHPLLERRPVTLVVTTDDLRPWCEQGHRFALINGNGWLLLGGRTELHRCHEPVLRELLVEPSAVD
ncbi:MAG: ATP-binding cassette domain-containing protein [Verrucomicrobia bacterium]|nr:ATP-binding cassette domain-containing protein [Verrucomicrobiota bacterium]